MTPAPDVVKLSKVPETEEGVVELRKVLLLVLGCAVQSPLREDVISNIKDLPLDTQHEIVQCIQEVGLGGAFVLVARCHYLWGGVRFLAGYKVALGNFLF